MKNHLSNSWIDLLTHKDLWDCKTQASDCLGGHYCQIRYRILLYRIHYLITADFWFSEDFIMLVRVFQYIQGSPCHLSFILEKELKASIKNLFLINHCSAVWFAVSIICFTHLSWLLSGYQVLSSKLIKRVVISAQKSNFSGKGTYHYLETSLRGCENNIS